MGRVSYAVRTAVLRGVEACPVIVEVSTSQGIPGVTIVGMADTAVQEARSRVRCAFRECGYKFPREHFTVNLAPSELKKTGTGFDLPIAVAILACTGQIPVRNLDKCLFVGELALTGQVCPVRGMVAFDLLAAQQGLTLVGPVGSTSIEGGQTRLIRSLAQLKQGTSSLELCPSGMCDLDDSSFEESELDFSEVIDQEMAKRACVIAASGDHGLLMVGPPGSGKSMIAKRIPTILAPLSSEEKAEAMLVYSAAGQDLGDIQRGRRPFRAPHHAITKGGLVGGGRPVRPGEISLAHHGVLFLDEMPEFGPSVLQALRQPMEDHEVRLVRVDGTYAFPCDFMLVGAANPCPCGYLGDPDHECSCSPARIHSYQSRIGGPLMDRIDVLVDVARPASSRIIAGKRGTSSKSMSEQVETARAYSSWRLARAHHGSDRECNVRELGLDDAACATLDGYAQRLGLGGRNIVRIARVARTIADLDNSESVSKDHVMEACAYRTRTSL
ncbi:MAG: YifB family Mg chelatase-like AAA ATPase [Coriobacteriales bacterium]|nr:YifB family Mg chelatase-like AAA ATPase [Coriobacteriales bacterium]